eukprot:3800341-Rhodomonas_salina.1
MSCFSHTYARNSTYYSAAVRPTRVLAGTTLRHRHTLSSTLRHRHTLSRRADQYCLALLAVFNCTDGRGWCEGAQGRPICLRTCYAICLCTCYAICLRKHFATVLRNGYAICLRNCYAMSCKTRAHTAQSKPIPRVLGAVCTAEVDLCV